MGANFTTGTHGWIPLCVSTAETHGWIPLCVGDMYCFGTIARFRVRTSCDSGGDSHISSDSSCNPVSMSCGGLNDIY